GSTTWNSRLRPCLALPPAESPSTINSSDLAGSRSWQSASLPGSEATPSAFLRVISRALRAASRAAAAWITLVTMVLASEGCSSNQYCSASLTMPSTTGRTSEDTSLSLVCEENFGSGTLQDRTQVSPSRQSSPVSATFSFCAVPFFSAYPVTCRVGAHRKPARWVPPSRCGMLLVKQSTVSWKLSFHVIAHSTVTPSRSDFSVIGAGISAFLLRSRYLTNSSTPPS